MKIVDAVGRELSPGDVICLQEVKNHDFTVVKIEDNILSRTPDQPPTVTIQLQCNLFMGFPNKGQAGIGLPVYLVARPDPKVSQGNA